MTDNSKVKAAIELLYEDLITGERQRIRENKDVPLTYKDMRDIRATYLQGMDVEDIAYLYNIGNGTVTRILYGCYKWNKDNCPEDLKVCIIKWHGGGRPVEPEDLDEEVKDWLIYSPEKKKDEVIFPIYDDDFLIPDEYLESDDV